MKQQLGEQELGEVESLIEAGMLLVELKTLNSYLKGQLPLLPQNS